MTRAGRHTLVTLSPEVPQHVLVLALYMNERDWVEENYLLNVFPEAFSIEPEEYLSLCATADRLLELGA